MKIYTWNQLNLIIGALKNNQALIVNTDTVKGIISFDPNLIYQIKNRNRNKKLIKLISHIDQIDCFLNPDLKKLINIFWPGPLTIILNQQAYRMPNYQPLLNLINLTGPVYSSSANLSNHAPIKTINSIKKHFCCYLNQIGVVEGLNEILNPSNLPSTIFDYDQQKILRTGAIDKNEILKIFKK